MDIKNKRLKSSQLKNIIIKQLYFDKALSCAELSDLFNRSIPVISKTVNELVVEGMVMEQGHAPSSGGRRPQTYSLKPDAMYILAIAMDQLSTRIQLFDLFNQPVAEQLNIGIELLNNPDALSSLVCHINNYITSTGTDTDKIAGMGIGMPGFVNVNLGINYTYLDSGDQTLTEYLTQATGISAYIDNDSSLIALAEQKFGLTKSQDSVMVINLGWGIGLGMIVGGEIFRGHNGFAGEFSHIPILEEGALCVCGKQGCLEAEASMLVVAKKAKQGIIQGRLSTLQIMQDEPPEKMGDAIMDAACSGDQFAIDLLSEAGQKIGKALAILIHIMNPETIILIGRGAKVGKILLAPIQQALNKYCIPRLAANTSLVISELGFDSEIIGAAVLVMENFDREIKNQIFTQKQTIMEK
ncbi:MAG: nagC 2 [Mucilaginibacter sp.]|nr:nagC 2 [Mucilaginibacter sp.]